MSSLRNNTKCFINILPSTEFDWDCIKIDVEKKVIYVRDLFECHSSPDVKVTPKFWCFKSDGIFMNCCQSEIYTTVVDQVIDKVFLGVDNVFMNYGQNFSGKTFSLSGFHNQFELRGIVPRFITDLFLQKETLEADVSTNIWVSSIDIYGGSIYDLFSKPIQLCKIKEVKKVKLKSETHCLELLFQAESKRKTVDRKTYNAHTATNIITFIIETVSLSSNEPYDKISRVHFVDLAGVETINRNPVTSFKERSDQGCANVTKTLLEVFSLRSKETNKNSVNNLHVNKRIHTITEYLDKSFSSVSNIIVMCHIRPNHEDLMITLSLLKFSRAVQGIPVKPLKHHLKTNNDMTMRNLQLEIESLKDEIFLRNLWGERSPMQISQDRVDFVRRSVKSFLNGNLTELELLSVVDDCSLILRFVKSLSNEEVFVENTSVALQTDELDFFSLLADKEGEEKRRKSVTKGSIGKERGSFVTKSSRRVSFEEKPKKASVTVKSKKDKSEKTSSAKPAKGKEKASKVQQKPVLVSQEVQVNLIEPNSKIPEMDSRAGLWAQFMISRPEIQVFLDKINNVVEEKDKILNSESLKFDDVKHWLQEKEVALNKMASLRHIDRSEVYDKDGRVVVSEEESSLVKEIKDLQKDFEVSQQKLTEAQTDWLDALDRMNCEKKIIEKEFKQFCVSNELFELNQIIQTQNQSAENLPLILNKDLPQTLEKEDTTNYKVSMISTEFPADKRLQEKYVLLQNKYLGSSRYVV